MKQKILGLIALLVLLTPQLAAAHSPIKGVSDFYNGLLHPFFSIPHILIVLSLGILLGQQLESKGTTISLAFAVSLAVGLGCATASIGFPAETYLLIGAGILGLLLILSRPLPQWTYILITVVMGLLMGIDFYSDTAKSKGSMNTGTGVTLYFCFLYLLLFSENFGKKKWQQIGIRVLGSWITACAMLVLSLSLFVKKL